jgi:hypothetical protein
MFAASDGNSCEAEFIFVAVLRLKPFVRIRARFGAADPSGIPALFPAMSVAVALGACAAGLCLPDPCADLVRALESGAHGILRGTRGRKTEVLIKGAESAQGGSPPDRSRCLS